MYHRFNLNQEDGKVSTATLEKQLCELKKTFHVVSISEFVERKQQIQTQGKNIVMITIDDGYADFYEHAFPVFKKYAVPATIYITTDFVNNNIWLWPDKIHYILKHTGELSADLSFIKSDFVFELKTAENKQYAFDFLNGQCLLLPTDGRNELIQQLADVLSVRIPEKPTSDYAPMTWDHVRELAENNIEIGAHTCTHPVMSKLVSDELHEEVTRSKAEIEQAIGRSINSFCYPNGTPADYNEIVKAEVEKAGFSHAVAAFHDASGWQDLYEIRRHGVGESMHGFRKVIHGIEYLSDQLKR